MGGAGTRFPTGVSSCASDFDPVAGTVHNHQVYIGAEGRRSSRRFVVHVYTVSEWVAMVREAGFSQVECFGDWDEAPPSHDTPLLVRAL